MKGFILGVLLTVAIAEFGAHLARWNNQHVALQKACDTKGGRIIGEGFWGPEKCFTVTQ